jgi:hypothetical protein
MYNYLLFLFLHWEKITEVGVVGRHVAKNRNGYNRVSFIYQGKKVTLMEHKLIWMKFHRRLIHDSLFIDHLDKQRSNNVITNLELVTQSENERRKRK